MSIVARIKMYLMSLSFLFLMIFIQVYDFSGLENLGSYRNIVGMINAFFAVIGFLSFIDFYESRKYVGDLPRKIDAIESQNFQAISFLATYIVPIAFIDFSQMRHAINAGILILIIGAIFVKTNLYYTNPILTLFGFNLYRATFGQKSQILISKFKLTVGDSVKIERLGDDVYFVRRKVCQ